MSEAQSIAALRRQLREEYEAQQKLRDQLAALESESSRQASLWAREREGLREALKNVLQYAEFSNQKHRGRAEFQHAHDLLARPSEGPALTGESK